MGDDRTAVNTEASLRNGTSQPRVGVGVLLVDQQGRVLLTLREFPPEAGCWSIVGGKLDFLEALEDCAVREASRRGRTQDSDRFFTLGHRPSLASRRSY
jgi:NUDIX domain-containing protein